MARDIDYAAIAVKTAIVGKYAAQIEPPELEVQATDKTISICHGASVAEGSRDALLAAVRKATTYQEFWTVLRSEGRCIRKATG